MYMQTKHSYTHIFFERDSCLSHIHLIASFILLKNSSEITVSKAVWLSRIYKTQQADIISIYYIVISCDLNLHNFYLFRNQDWFLS